jgi:protein phosphatase 2C family protein 2/3
MDQKTKPFGANQRGRIILLGDGTEVLTDSDDTEMFDHGDEDRDLESQVNKGHRAESDKVTTEPEVKGAADAVLPKSASTDTTTSEK